MAITLTGGMVLSGCYLAPSYSDPYWSSVSFLTNFENNLSFNDDSINNFVIGRVGTVNPSLNSPSSGGGSFYFNGVSSSLLSIPSNVALEFGTGDFTIECWLYPAVSKSQIAYFSGANSGNTGVIGIFITATTNIPQVYTIMGSGAVKLASSIALTIGAWNHLAVTRQSGTTRIFVDGVLGGSVADTNSYTADAPSIGEARAGTAVNNWNGNISNFRIVKGTALYTANFTVPTAPLTAVSGTSLLLVGTKQGMYDNSVFVDQGPNALAVTAAAAVKYSGLSPFGSTYPGSFYLNGSTTGYISVANAASLNMDASDFTQELYFYPTVAQQGILFSKKSTTFATEGVNLYMNANRTITLEATTNGTSWNATITTTTALVLNIWSHIAITRATNTWTIWINGVSAGTITIAGTVTTSTGPLYIGNLIAYGASFLTIGNISNIRIVKGIALYATNFTPSITPLTAITNTALLIRGDTGAFYDLSINGNLESSTGTTAITTQVKKYGLVGASYATTSYQTVSNAANLQLNSGDYTIEMWVYRSTAGVLHSLACKGAAATGWLLQINASNQLVFTATSTAMLTSTTTIPATTWTFVAVTRSGTSTRIFVNGNLESTATDSTNFSETEPLIIGTDRSSLNGLNGYLDDVRITKGIARYTSSFIPPLISFPIS